ncbi:hypothetical protein XM38_000890 [Halomicronema hongdechloris C2206]|uniref:Uncharacterized protein n=1 Tax=Halomicronema hongdechloris C2206 TaxID=1641165 RepID=A0A1Z3HFU6_9CYAN|nr:hypothetical protein [Halomicronema hongdechloris]ASC69163.1 hypothetical protein XM38_000890 [Halomicronema hongdechloris C2206]
MGQLRAIEALQPLLKLLVEYEYDDYFCEEIPEVLALMGPEVLPDLMPYLAREGLSEWSKIPIAEGIKLIGNQYPDAQATCVEILWQQLKAYRDNADGLNGWLVDGLVKFQVVEAADLIAAVYAEGNIDEMCAGTWPRVQVDLGLKAESDFEPDDFVPESIRELRAALPQLEAFSEWLNDLSNQGKVSAVKSGLPLDLDALASETPAKFGQGSLKAPKPSSPTQVQGFGSGGTQAASPSKKFSKKSSKKKKKKKK